MDFATEHELRSAITKTSSSSCHKPDVEQELTRLRDLLSFCVLDSGKEELFDSLTENIRDTFNASWATISLIDLGRQWLKSYAEHEDAPLEHVHAGTELPRQQSFCAHTILQDGIMIVPDATHDERFRDNPAVTGEQHLRFYAGAPLISPDGNKIGTIAVMANQPRPGGLTADDERILNDQASAVVELLVQRREQLEASQSQRKRTNSKVDGGDRKVERTGSDLSASISSMSRSTSASSLASLADSTEIDASSVAAVGRTEESSGKRSRANSPAPPSNRYLEDEIIPSPHPPLQVLLPSPKTEGVDPDEYLSQLVQALQPGLVLKIKTSKSLGDYFPVISEEQMAGYSTEVVNLARTNDVGGLKAFFREHGRDALNCYNRFGEGLLNLSCRRGFTEMTQFLLSPEVNLAVRMRDDYGRTCLHDTCWNPEPLLDTCTWIMQKDPSLFLVADDRGFTPFQYARKSDWNVWRQFLFDHREYLQPLTNHAIAAKFS